MTNIGVFDSGLGGLTVLKELVKDKKANYFYFGDSLRAPYGNLSNSKIIDFSDQIVKFLENYNIDQYIIACNTISTLATDYLKEKYKKSFYPITESGLEDALTFKGDFLVLATQTTVNSHFYKKNIEKNSEAFVHEVAAPNLVSLIEDGVISGKKLDESLEEYLKIANKNHIPNIILGCTHYPIIKNEIERNLAYKANIINPAVNISSKLNFKEDDETSVNIFMSEVNEKNKQIIDKILACDYKLMLKEI